MKTYFKNYVPKFCSEILFHKFQKDYSIPLGWLS